MTTRRITVKQLPDPLTSAADRHRQAYARKWGVPMPTAAEPEERDVRPAVKARAEIDTIIANLITLSAAWRAIDTKRM